MHDELLCGVLLSTKIDQQLKFDNIVKKKMKIIIMLKNPIQI